LERALADDICVSAYFEAMARIVKPMCSKCNLHARNAQAWHLSREREGQLVAVRDIR
jgi:hypothetical protein